MIAGRASITIDQLWARARAVAGAFERLGVQPGDRIAIVLDKSIESITALFAALAAGAAYVPIPPQWPRPRMQSALEQCRARLVIACQSDGESEPAIVDLRSDRSVAWSDALRSSPAFDEGAQVDLASPAFILYTSGSTGTPKGVTISHKAVGAFVDWTADTFAIGPDDRVLCPAPLSFDLSTLDVLNIARSASACVIVPETSTWVPRFLLQFARGHAVTVWYSVPSLLTRLLDDGRLEREPLDSLRALLFAGEVMPTAAAVRLRRSHPHADLCNLYGPTETNVVTWHRLLADVDPSRPIPIGRPCPYARIRLDPEDESRSGCERTGHLLVSGDSLMSGYWGRPEETSAAFVDLEEHGEMTRYYRTGDRVTLDADHVIQFVGRVDRQVKRRGFRIELGDIEAAIARSPDVAEVAVSVAGEKPGLVIRAFVRSRAGAATGTLGLRAHCAQVLPPHMLPDEFVLIDAIPRGSRGKIDYQALARMGDRRS